MEILDKIFFSLVALGVIFQTTILFIPQGFNSDAATSSLHAFDIISQENWIYFGRSAHTEVVLRFIISPVTILIPIFLTAGFVDWGVRAAILVYNLLSAFFLYKLGRLWFNKRVALISLVFFLFSPWTMSHFNLTVPTAFLFTVMPIYLHQIAVRDKKYLPIAYSFLGLSFYFFVTAKIIISFYLILYSLFNPKKFLERSNLISFVLFLLIILPWLSFNLSSPQKEIILRPSFLNFKLPLEYFLFISVAIITPFLFSSFFMASDYLKESISGRANFPSIFMGCWLFSVIPAIILTPVAFRARVIYYAAPAFILLSSVFYDRLSRDRLIVILLSFAVSGIFIHSYLSSEELASRPMNFEYGLDKVTNFLLMQEDVDWVYTDLRMDKQILFYSQRKLPLMETDYPYLDMPTFPWLKYVPENEIKEGCSYYVFWADYKYEEFFLGEFEDQIAVYYVDYPSGKRAINVYRLCQ